MAATRTELERQVESALALRFPDVELVDLELRGGRTPTLTLFVDRPGGVDLELCAAVTQALDELRERYTVEVSSPGLNRRLRRPAHFAAAVGSDIAVRTAGPRDGRSNYRGRLLAADDEGVTLVLNEGQSVQLPYESIARAHVLFNFEANGGQRE
jgi:ribosome maturation factor RimP